MGLKAPLKHRLKVRNLVRIIPVLHPVLHPEEENITHRRALLLPENRRGWDSSDIPEIMLFRGEKVAFLRVIHRLGLFIVGFGTVILR